MKNELYIIIRAYCLDILLILSSLRVGLYYEWSACAVSILLIFRLLECRRCHGAIRMPGGGLLWKAKPPPWADKFRTSLI